MNILIYNSATIRFNNAPTIDSEYPYKLVKVEGIDSNIVYIPDTSSMSFYEFKAALQVAQQNKATWVITPLNLELLPQIATEYRNVLIYSNAPDAKDFNEDKAITRALVEFTNTTSTASVIYGNSGDDVIKLFQPLANLLTQNKKNTSFASRLFGH